MDHILYHKINIFFSNYAICVIILAWNIMQSF